MSDIFHDPSNGDEKRGQGVSRHFVVPLDSATNGRLVFASGAAGLTIHADPTLPDLYRAHFEHCVPNIHVRDGTELDLFPAFSAHMNHAAIGGEVGGLSRQGCRGANAAMGGWLRSLRGGRGSLCPRLFLLGQSLAAASFAVALEAHVPPAAWTFRASRTYCKVKSGRSTESR